MASVLDLVKHYQHTIEKYPNDEQRVLKSIDKLYNLDVTVQHLQDTGVGRTVNALRKEPGSVGQAAKALVYKWKVMVASEESDQEDHNNDTTSQNGHANGKSYEDSSRQSNNRHENSVKEPKSEDKHNKQINGDYGSKRKYHSSEEDDPHTKKAKYSSSKDNSYKIKTETKMKIEPKNESEDSQDDSSQSDSDSEYSQSSEEDRKQEVKEKVEKTNRHESSKQPSSRDKHKLESDSKNTIERSDKYHRHSSSENRHSSDKILKEKSNYSDSHKRSKERERSNEIKEKEHKYMEKEKKHRDESTSKHSERHRSSSSLEKHSSSSKKGSSSKSSSESFDIQKSSSSEKHRSSNSSERHKSTSSSEKHKSSVTEKQKINSDKCSSQSDKSSSHIDKHSSSKSGKEKHKHSEKETNDKHKSKDSSSSKDKHSSSSKDKSKDTSSSNDKEYSEKSDKKHSKDKESKYDKQNSDHEKSKKRKHKSSKSKDSEPKKKRSEDSDDGIDCGSGASFAEALGMISPAKPKKKPAFRDTASPNSSNEDLSPATLLAPSAKLAPLPALEISALPEISNNYRPRPPPKFLPHFTDEEALSAGISSKNQRTKVYSGNKVIGKITSLYELCVQVLQEHIDALEYTGGVPYEILKPVVDKATPQQLFMLEHYNAYLMDDTDHLWQKFCEKNFRNKKRAEMETWREMYMRCQEEQEIKLKSLTANIRIAQEAKKAPIKQTKMAYVDSVVKPPRNILKKQAQHGTAFAATASPAARVASLAAAPNVLKGGRPAPVPISTSSSSSFKPKKAPLMQKALQFMRGRKR